MLSRVAEAIYWMSRYLERAENVARMMDTQLQMMLDLPPMREDPNAWMPLVSITGDEAAFREKYDRPSQENVMFFHTFDTGYPNSVISCLTAARENARSIREIIPSEMWEQINRLYLKVQDTEAGTLHRHAHLFYTDMKMACHLILGIFYATMSRNEAWQFAEMGRFLERADKTSRILDVKYFLLLPRLDYVGSSWDSVQWSTLLKSNSASEMYRKKYHVIDPKSIVEFLIFDREFPRSVQFCLHHGREALFRITGHREDSIQNELERQFGRLCAQLAFSNVNEVMGFGLHEFLDRLQSDLNRLGEAIFEEFFAVKPTTHLQQHRAAFL